MGSLRVIRERAFEQHDGMDHAPANAPRRHDAYGLPALTSQPVKGLDLTLSFEEVERHVLPALHVFLVQNFKPVVYRPDVPEARWHLVETSVVDDYLVGRRPQLAPSSRSLLAIEVDRPDCSDEWAAV